MLVWNLSRKSYFDEELVYKTFVKADGAIIILDPEKVKNKPKAVQVDFRDYRYFVLGGCRYETANEAIYYNVHMDMNNGAIERIGVGIFDIVGDKYFPEVTLTNDRDKKKIKQKILDIDLTR